MAGKWHLGWWAHKKYTSLPRADSEQHQDVLQALPCVWTPAGAEETQEKFLSCPCTRRSFALSLAPKPGWSPVAVPMGKTLPRPKEGQDEGLPTPKESFWTQIDLFYGNQNRIQGAVKAHNVGLVYWNMYKNRIQTSCPSVVCNPSEIKRQKSQSSPALF